MSSPAKSKRQKNKVEESKNPSSSSIFHKALTARSTFEKDEYLDVIYWIRQIIGLVFGVIWGVIPLYGIVGIALFFALNAGLLYLYFTYYQPADEEEVGDTWELTKEGFMSSIAIFLVAWIMTYSGIHFD